MNPDSEIAALEGRLRVGMLHSDLTVLDALISDELVFVAPDEAVLDKAADLELHRSGSQRISRLDVTDMQVRWHGELAVTTMLALVAGSFHAQPFDGQFRYMRTWAKGDSGWRMIAGCEMACADAPG